MRYLKGFFHHYFLPHESNNYRAKSLHPSHIFFYIILLLVLQIGTTWVRHFQQSILGFATDITSQKILELVNEKRIQNNVSPLHLSQELTTAAASKASDMFTYNYWAHISPVGISPWAFITSAGYEYVYAGENLAKDFYEPQDVVEAWMNSPTHRANLLKSEYKDIGIAVVNGKLNGQETTLVVQEFGSRLAKAPIVQGETKSIIPSISLMRENSQAAEVPDNYRKMATLQEGKTKPSILTRFVLGLTSKTISLLAAEILLVVLFLDSLYMWRHRMDRLVSHSFAHFIFIAAIIGAMSIAGIGVIL